MTAQRSTNGSSKVDFACINLPDLSLPFHAQQLLYLVSWHSQLSIKLAYVIGYQLNHFPQYETEPG